MRPSLPFVFRVLPLLPVAAIALAVSVQTGCTSDVVTQTTTTGAAPAAGCREGESLRQIGTRSLCCDDDASKEAACFEANTTRANDPCAKAGDATRGSDVVRITLDVCIIEQCNGNRNASQYAVSSVLKSTALTCTGGSGGTLLWQASGASDVQTVTRTCAQVATKICAAGYGYDYGYSNYGYGYGGRAVPERAVTLVSSVCSKGAAPETPCAVGNL